MYSDVSVRQRLVWGVFLSVGLSWVVIFLWSYHAAKREVAEWDDARLMQTAALLVRLDRTDLQRIGHVHIDARNELARLRDGLEYDSDFANRFVYFQVFEADNSLLAASKDFPPIASSGRTIGKIERISTNSTTWLLYVMTDDTSGRRIALTEQVNTQSDLVSGAAARIAMPALIVLPLCMLLIWLNIGAALRPLEMLSKAVATRNSGNLRPILLGSTPSELGPVVESTNGLLERLSQSLAHERAFTADAAHQLKTPLAAIKVQAQLAQFSDDVDQRRLAVERVVLGVDRSSRLIEQLLLLARLDEDGRPAVSRLNLFEVVSEAVDSAQPNARAQNVHVELAGNESGEISANRLLVRSLIDNLLDNCLKHGGRSARIRVNVELHSNFLTLGILDNGPGVSIEERSRLTDRFFRSSNAKTAGNGLGLSVASRIVAHCGGSIAFHSGINGQGLGVTVRFPLPGDTNRNAADRLPPF